MKPEEVLPTVDGAVEVGTKTEVGVTATAYDVRPGESRGMAGCGEEGGDGCAPANSRDGIVSEVESRWSCSSKLVEGGGPCQIEYTFAEPQDVVDIQVAFWKGDVRDRTLEVSDKWNTGAAPIRRIECMLLHSRPAVSGEVGSDCGPHEDIWARTHPMGEI